MPAHVRDGGRTEVRSRDPGRPQPDADHAGLLLHLADMLGIVTTADELAAALTHFTSNSFRARTVLGYLQRDRIRISSIRGFTAEVCSRWTNASVPLDEPSPMTDAVRGRRTVEIQSVEAFDRMYPDDELDRPGMGDCSAVAVPLHDTTDGYCVAGVLRLSWPYPNRLEDEAWTPLQTVVSMAELALSRIALSDRAQADRFRHALDAILEQVTISRAVRDEAGRIVDFEIEYVNVSGTDGAKRSQRDMIGRRLRELYPGLVPSGLFDAFVSVVESGRPFVADRLHYEDITHGGQVPGGHWNLRVTQFGDGILSAASDVTDAVAAERIAEENARLLERERTVVELLQSTGLPPALPAMPGVSIAAVYRPAEQGTGIGGDWYDAIRLDGGRVGLVIGDVAGHGRDAASSMVQFRNALRALAIEHDDPHIVLERLNTVALALGEHDDPFVTCLYAVLDPASGRLSWCKAGHFDPLIVAADGARSYPTAPTGPPLNVQEDPTYASAELLLARGDRLLLFTDGLIERRHETIDVGLARLAEHALPTRACDSERCLQSVLEIVEDQYDDLAVMCIDLV